MDGQRDGESGTTTFDLLFTESADVQPLDLVGNAHLALHHHMSPADPDDDK